MPDAANGWISNGGLFGSDAASRSVLTCTEPYWKLRRSGCDGLSTCWPNMVFRSTNLWRPEACRTTIRCWFEVYADVLGKPIVVHPSKQGPALGAAILGVMAAGRKASGFNSAAAAIRSMAAARKDMPGAPSNNGSASTRERQDV